MDSSIIRLKDLNAAVGASAIVFVKFTSTFDVFANITTKSCADILHIGTEYKKPWVDYCNINKPPLDVWTPHSADSEPFFFWLVLSSALPTKTEAFGFSLEYSGT